MFTSTHDTDTAVGWFVELSRRASIEEVGRNSRRSDSERTRVLGYLDCAAAEVHWALIRCAYRSPADLAIVPVQDVLGLGSGARMNSPASARGNWRWRLEPNALTPAIARRLRELAEMHQRGAGSSVPISS